MTSEEKKLFAIFAKVSKITDKGNCFWSNCSDKSILSHSHTKSTLKNIAKLNKV